MAQIQIAIREFSKTLPGDTSTPRIYHGLLLLASIFMPYSWSWVCTPCHIHKLSGGLELAISRKEGSKFPQPPFVEVTENMVLGNYTSGELLWFSQIYHIICVLGFPFLFRSYTARHSKQPSRGITQKIMPGTRSPPTYERESCDYNSYAFVFLPLFVESWDIIVDRNNESRICTWTGFLQPDILVESH